MHVNDEKVTLRYHGSKAEASVSLLRPGSRGGWRVTVWQATWGEGIGARYSSIDHHHTYLCKNEQKARARFATLSAAMVAAFCGSQP